MDRPIARSDLKSRLLRLVTSDETNSGTTIANSDGQDRVIARKVMERTATQEYITVNSAGAAEQIVSGVFPNDRWMSKAAIVLLKPPATPRNLRAEFYIPPNAKASQRSWHGVLARASSPGWAG